MTTTTETQVSCPPSAVRDTIAEKALATLRVEVRSLLGLIDTARRPAPTGIVPPSQRNPGAVWKLRGRWAVRTISDDDAPGDYVYVATSQHWDGDFEAMPLEEARALAMSLLAACEWAERTGPVDWGRYPELDEEAVPTGRSFICGPIAVHRYDTREYDDAG